MRSRSQPPCSVFLRGVALIALGVQLLGLGHLAFERHGVCWEHGEVTELQGADLSASSASTANHDLGFRSGSPTVRPENVVGHHHCSVQATRRDWAPAAAAALSIALGPDAAGITLAEDSPRADRVLLRAPKQSPPSVA